MPKCKTPGTVYSTTIHNGGSITVMVTLPHTLAMTNAGARRLKARLHRAVESALSDTFRFDGMARASLHRTRHTYMIEKEND